MTTVTIWIPKSDLENFRVLNIYLSETPKSSVEVLKSLKSFPITIHTEKMHIECLQVNVSLDLFVKLNLK